MSWAKTAYRDDQLRSSPYCLLDSLFYRLQRVSQLCYSFKFPAEPRNLFRYPVGVCVQGLADQKLVSDRYDLHRGPCLRPLFHQTGLSCQVLGESDRTAARAPAIARRSSFAKPIIMRSLSDSLKSLRRREFSLGDRSAASLLSGGTTSFPSLTAMVIEPSTPPLTASSLWGIPV